MQVDSLPTELSGRDPYKRDFREVSHLNLSIVFLTVFLYAGRDWGQGEKGTTEDEMAGWHDRLDGREFE